jgi:hypothetical protein
MPTFPVPPKPKGEDWNRYKWFKEPAQPYLRQSLEAHEIRCDVKDAAERQVLRDNAGKDRKEPDDKLAKQVHAGECMEISNCGIVITALCGGIRNKVNNTLKRLTLSQLPVPIARNNEEQGELHSTAW